MARAWVVRAGERADEIDAMRAAGRVGLRYEEVGDAREWTWQQIEQAIRATGAEGAEQSRSRLLRFTFDVRVGDLVVTPNSPDREVWFSVVTGSYEYDEVPLVAHHPHTRTADWLGWVPRESPWLRHKLTYLDTPAAVLELRDPDWWFAQIQSVDLPRDRPHRPPVRAAAPPPERTARGAAAPRTSTPRTTAPRASTPRVSTPRAPAASKEPDRLLCGGQCGLQWRTAVLVDGLCPDCRGD